MSNLKRIGILGRATKDQKNGYGYDVVVGQLCVLTEGYDQERWEPVSIDANGGVFSFDHDKAGFLKAEKDCRFLDSQASVMKEALEYIKRAQSRSCQKRGCTCVFDTARIALDKILKLTNEHEA